MRIALTFEFSFEHDAFGGGHVLFEDMIKVLDGFSSCAVFCFVADTETEKTLAIKFPNIIFISYGIKQKDSIYSRFKKIRQTHKTYQKLNFDKIISHTREVFALLTLGGYKNKLVLFIAYPKAVSLKAINKNNFDIFCFYIPILLRRVHVIYLSKFISSSTEAVLGNAAVGEILRPYFDNNMIVQFNQINESNNKVEDAADKKIRIISVGRIDFTQKPLLIYLKTLFSITTNVELIVVGDGPDFKTLESFLNNQSKDTNLTVTLHKNLSRMEIINEMGKADLALLPSLYESFMLTAYEAFLSGCTLMVNDVANLKADFHAEPGVFFLEDETAEITFTKALHFVALGKQVRNVGAELDRLQLSQKQYTSTLKKVLTANV